VEQDGNGTNLITSNNCWTVSLGLDGAIAELQVSKASRPWFPKELCHEVSNEPLSLNTTKYTNVHMLNNKHSSMFGISVWKSNCSCSSSHFTIFYTKKTCRKLSTNVKCMKWHVYLHTKISLSDHLLSPATFPLGPFLVCTFYLELSTSTHSFYRQPIQL